MHVSYVNEFFYFLSSCMFDLNWIRIEGDKIIGIHRNEYNFVRKAYIVSQTTLFCCRNASLENI